MPINKHGIKTTELVLKIKEKFKSIQPIGQPVIKATCFLWLIPVKQQIILHFCILNSS